MYNRHRRFDIFDIGISHLSNAATSSLMSVGTEHVEMSLRSSCGLLGNNKQCGAPQWVAERWID